MNDYWNDPPEDDLEPPYCDKCKEFMEIAENWITAKCPTCGMEWAAPPEPEVPEPVDIELPDDYLKEQ